MDPHKLAVTLAIAAAWLSFNSLVITAYFLLSKRTVLEGGGWKMAEWLKLGRQLTPAIERRSHVQPSADNTVVKVSTSSTLPEQDDSLEEVLPVTEEDNNTHVLFVMFDQPDTALNKKLQVSLQKWEAHYDEVLKVYVVPGVTPQNPMRVANAYPPGEMPPPASFLQTEQLVSGVSVILKKPQRKRGFDKVQLKKLIEFSRELAALGGSILDVDRQPSTPETFKVITQG
ncbi:hypothetical protein ACQKE4_20120 [Halomonas sp. NPDC076908]|uniref:hypothetical protein n=1 Tax=Halomonas sp. NPDC076908 TaxID=3390567 RepID=UPI003D027E0A